jgi:hypothetical protein
MKENVEFLTSYQFPEVSSDKFRLYITAAKTPGVNQIAVGLFEIVVTGRDDINLCSAGNNRFDVNNWNLWEGVPAFSDMAHYWWYGKGKFFADKTKLSIDMNYFTPTSKSIVPEDKSRCSE